VPTNPENLFNPSISAVAKSGSALSGVIYVSSSEVAWSRATLLRALAERNSVLSFDQAFSIGFRSGE